MTGVPGFAWVLNLDADVELGATGAYQPTNAVRVAMTPHVRTLAGSLLEPGDVLVDETSPPGSARGRVGRAFCPTPRALAILQRAGAEAEAHPSRDVLRTVNSRAFSASIGQTLPEAAFVRDHDDAVARLACAPTIADRWRVKRCFGMAGRGQRVVAPGPLSEPDRTWLRAGIAEGGVQIEPNVRIERELGQHAWLAPDGTLQTGRLVAQRCDERGQWISTTVAEDVDDGLSTSIAREVERAGVALHLAGYFGPFGIDAFVYRTQTGATALQPRSEINARYSMGFAVGFGRSPQN